MFYPLFCPSISINEYPSTVLSEHQPGAVGVSLILPSIPTHLVRIVVSCSRITPPKKRSSVTYSVFNTLLAHNSHRRRLSFVCITSGVFHGTLQYMSANPWLNLSVPILTLLVLQFDNFRRVFKAVEEEKGYLAENISRQFLLSEKLALYANSTISYVFNVCLLPVYFFSFLHSENTLQPFSLQIKGLRRRRKDCSIWVSGILHSWQN